MDRRFSPAAIGSFVKANQNVVSFHDAAAGHLERRGLQKPAGLQIELARGDRNTARNRERAIINQLGVWAVQRSARQHPHCH